jgi:hypothetical protein
MIRPRLFQVMPTDDFRVFLYFDNGEVRLYDCRWILDSTGVFEKIKDPGRFRDLCTIMNGTLAWDTSGKRDPYDCIDICPDTVYQDSLRTADPLRTGML